MSVWDRLDEIQARADKATDGPWEWEATHPTMAGARWNLRIAGKPGIRLVVGEYQQGPDNAEFIAHARTDVPALVAALEAALDACAEIRANNTGTDLRAGGAAAAVIIELAIENALKENR